MSRLSSRVRLLPLLAFLLLLPCLTPPILSQVIPIKTVPVASGDQFFIIPSRNVAMGGVSIALEDPLADPFMNPARVRRSRASHVFGATSFYHISDDHGSGRTLPLGLVARFGSWYVGAVGALQQMTPATPVRATTRWPVGEPNPDFRFDHPPMRGTLPGNHYLFGMIAREFADGRLAVGVSGFQGYLEGMEGVDLLYAGSLKIEQWGYMDDYRIGVTGLLEGEREFEAMLIRNRVKMTHDVTYGAWEEIVPGTWSYETEVRRNLDRSGTWGVQLGYLHPLPDGWKVGGALVGNWKDHPHIPEYELENSPPIPKDPGNSWAYQFGIGASRREGPSLFAAELAFEPIWTETWGVADEATLSAMGWLIPPGGKTIENDFRFRNFVLRTGLSREFEHHGFQLGVEMRSVNYRMVQWDNIEGTRRSQDEHWLEWTPSWGAHLGFPEFQIRYVGRLTTGTGRPGAVGEGGWLFPRDLTTGGGQVGDNFILAPNGELLLDEAQVVTHQIAVIVPLRF